ncbi:hypothetical protein FEM48_Zijuj09G0084800 [Ziziphus jujuba var. spinosa]|uniref:Gnk2-homologous domain-containing protein n=1 Tax=Ziziphus jujuba var. spinosa TaxID=714518 RepID=A0A978URX7_ZIZJJ|nr:hypothetical protein FEM48_Zijuj09G0084800 [Ziziphus jujuba var. spinosa]
MVNLNRMKIDRVESADPLGDFCNKDTEISKGSPISSNIAALLAKLVSNIASNGYVTTSYGKDPNQVYGLAQCRGDVDTKDCSACIQDAANQIRQRCPNEADARIWYDYCFLRYNTKNFIGEIDTSYGIFYYNINNVSDPESFKKALGNLVDKVRAQAVETKNEGLGKGETKLSEFVTLYALAQCTRDLSKIDCAQCVAIAVGSFETICRDRQGCRVLYSSCYVRYELYPFFFPIGSNNASASQNQIVVVYP